MTCNHTGSPRKWPLKWREIYIYKPKLNDERHCWSGTVYVQHSYVSLVMSKDLVLLWICQLKQLLTQCCQYFTVLKVLAHSTFTSFKLYTQCKQGTGIKGLTRGTATVPQGNQELLVVRDKVGRLPGELGVSKSMECDIFHSVLWHCWLGNRKGIWPVKNWILVRWWWWFDWSFARFIAPVVQLSPPPPTSFASINTG